MTVFDWEFAIDHIPEVLKGVPITLLIAVVSIVIGSFVGLFMALIRVYRVPVLNQMISQ